MGPLTRALAALLLACASCGKTVPSNVVPSEAARVDVDASSSVPAPTASAPSIADFRAACAACPHTCCTDGRGGFECSKSEPKDCYVYVLASGNMAEPKADCWCAPLPGVYEPPAIRARGTCPIIRGCPDTPRSCFDLSDQCVLGRIVLHDGGY
ncbi:hypothetical protein BH09MYX1_BH09MYX1_26660 [soil metagenome]